MPVRLALGAVLALVAAIAAAGPAIAQAPADKRSDDAKKPVVFVAGFETERVNCDGHWKKLWARLRATDVKKQSFRDTKFESLAPGRTVRGEYGSEPEPGGCVSLLARGQGIEQQARNFSAWLRDNYSGNSGENRKNPPQPVDVVGYGTGGLIVRYALGMAAAQQTPGWPAPLLVEDAITVGTPHAGAPALNEDCSTRTFLAGLQTCREMDPRTADGKKLFERLAQPAFVRADGAGGTDWTVIGSKGDELVKADSAIAMDADHKTTYLDKGLSHDELLTDTSAERDAKIVYSRRDGPAVEWNKAPHVADRIAYDLVFGGGELGDGSGTDCAGSTDEKGGPTRANADGITEWAGRKGEVSYIKLGVIEAYADCFVKRPDGRFESAGVVRMNGLDITPSGNETIILDLKKRLLSSSKASVSIPSQWFGRTPVPLRQDAPLEWLLPKTDGPVQGDENDLIKLIGPGKIAGFGIVDGIEVKLDQGKVEIGANLALPKIFGADASIGTKLISTNATGLIIDKISGKAEGLKVKRLGFLRKVAFEYSRAENAWEAEGTVVVPLPRAPELTIKAGFQNGALKSLAADLDNFNYPLGTTPFLLQQVKLGLMLDPFEFETGAALTLGPRFEFDDKKISILQAEGAVKFSSSSDPDSGNAFKVSGKLSLLGGEIGSGSYEVKATGVTVDAALGLSLEFRRENGTFKGSKVAARIQGRFNGAIDATGLDMSARAQACFGAEVKFFLYEGKLDSSCLVESITRASIHKVGSSFDTVQIGYSGCGTLDLGLWSGSVGFGAKQTVDLAKGELGPFSGDLMDGACDVDRWNTTKGRAFTAQSSPTGSDLTVDGRPDATMIGVSGRGAPPRIALIKPDGSRIEAPPAAGGIVRGDGYAFIHLPADNTTYVIVAKPRPGRWRVEAQPGSSEIVAVQTANALPEPKVRVRVRRSRGGARALSYSVRPIAGQRVLLAEVGPGLVRAIGEARSRRGVLRFRPAFGPAGKRRIVATVTQRGVPRTQLTAGSYTAPAPTIPSPPQSVRLRRKGSRLFVTWSRVPGAEGYRVTVRTADGRTLHYRVGPRERRTIVVERVLGLRPQRVSVASLRLDGLRGRTRTVLGGGRRAPRGLPNAKREKRRPAKASRR